MDQALRVVDVKLDIVDKAQQCAAKLRVQVSVVDGHDLAAGHRRDNILDTPESLFGRTGELQRLNLVLGRLGARRHAVWTVGAGGEAILLQSQFMVGRSDGICPANRNPSHPEGK